MELPQKNLNLIQQFLLKSKKFCYQTLTRTEGEVARDFYNSRMWDLNWCAVDSVSLRSVSIERSKK